MGSLVEGARRWLRDHPLRARTAVSLVLGQLLALLVTGTGITSSLLARQGVNMPTTQSLINYGLLSLYLIPLWRREGSRGLGALLRLKWWVYALLALCDVEANFLVVLAYQYTSLSSVMLLDCFSIPCVMLLGRWILHHTFRWPQYAGVVACVVGVVALVLSDWLQGARRVFLVLRVVSPRGAGAWIAVGHNSTTGSMLLGDGLVLGGSVLYAVSNTGQELQVARLGSKLEYLALLGTFGLPISAVQSAALDHSAWVQTTWTPQSVGLMIGFALCLFLMYSLVPLLLELAGATFLNLSLLTSDVLAVVAGIFLFHYVPSLFYLLSSLLIVAGLLLWNVDPTNRQSTVVQEPAATPITAAEESVDAEAMN